MSHAEMTIHSIEEIEAEYKVTGDGKTHWLTITATDDKGEDFTVAAFFNAERFEPVEPLMKLLVPIEEAQHEHLREESDAD